MLPKSSSGRKDSERYDGPAGTRSQSTMNDIFISYTFHDNKLKWVERFQYQVQVRLSDLLGRESKVYFAQRENDEGVSILSSTIREQLGNSKILISVLTPFYINSSSWCHIELATFKKVLAKRHKKVDETRSLIVKAVKIPVDPPVKISVTYEGKPEEVDLSDVEDAPFYEADDKGGALELDPKSRAFKKKVNSLAWALTKILKQLDKEPNARESVAINSGKVVFIADTTMDVREKAEDLRDILAQQYGHNVLPAPTHGVRYADSVRDRLSKADLVVHLIGAAYGEVPEGERVSVVELQYVLARKERERRRKEGHTELRQIVCMAPDLQSRINDDRQLAFSERLKQGPFLPITTFNQLKSAVEKALEQTSALDSRTSAAPFPENCRLNVYLIFDVSDAEPAIVVADALRDADFNVATPRFEGEEANIRDHDQGCFKECDAVLIYCDAATLEWLQQRLRDFQKAPGYGVRVPDRACGVIVGAKRAGDIGNLSARVIEMCNGFSNDALEPFVTEIRRLRQSTS